MKVIAFDVFGTLFDLGGVPIPELQAYQKHLREFRESGEWKPLSFPESWERLPAFEDSASGLRVLRFNYFVCTCSNAPLGLQAKLFKHAHMSVDAFIPLELGQTFKTNPKAYMMICDVLGVEPKDVLMVTANEHFGDLEASQALGMTPCLIRKYPSLESTWRLFQLLTEARAGAKAERQPKNIAQSEEEYLAIQRLQTWATQ